MILHRLCPPSKSIWHPVSLCYRRWGLQSTSDWDLRLRLLFFGSVCAANIWTRAAQRLISQSTYSWARKPRRRDNRGATRRTQQLLQAATTNLVVHAFKASPRPSHSIDTPKLPVLFQVPIHHCLCDVALCRCSWFIQSKSHIQATKSRKL